MFAIGDDDFWPSVPHGHSNDKKYVLRIWSGEIFEKRTKKLRYLADEIEMQKLKQDEKFREFVVKAREAYEDRNIWVPKMNLKNLPLVYEFETVVYPVKRKKLRALKGRVKKIHK